MAHIMIVDDEHDVVTLMKFLFEKDGHRTSAAYNGVEALAALGIEPPDAKKPIPDLIILDVMMPIMDGYSVTARLAADPRARRVPLVVLTAKGDMRDIFEVAPNVAAYVEKPFDPKALRELVTGMLAKENRRG